MLRDHHREDVHLLLELHGVDVPTHDDRLVGPGQSNLRKSDQQGGIQHIGIIDGNPVQVEDGISVTFLEPAARAGADPVPPQEAGVQVIGRRFGRGFPTADQGEIGKALGFVIFHHIVGNATAERTFLHLSVHGKGWKGLRWHNY